MYFTKKKIVLLFLLFMLSVFNISGEKAGNEQEDEGIRDLNKKKTGILVSPILFYLPETRIAFGMVGNYVFRLDDKQEASRPSTISPLFIYTQNKQFKGLLTGDIYLKKGNYHIIADIIFRKYPDKFFGIGSYIPDDYEENFTPHIFGIELSFLKKIKQHINIGLRYDFQSYNMVKYEDDKLLSRGDIPGSRGSMLSGFSILANLDSRNNIFFPTRGEFCRVTARFFNKIFGSEFTFQSYKLDMRKYFPVFSSHVLAVQSVVQTQTGTVPFHRLSRIGGQYVMRGYYDGNFRDRNVIILQTEYRLPLFWRFGAVGFAGVADVAHRFRDFKFDNLKHSIGFGLRYLFNKREKMYVRFDMGFGKGVSGFYFSVFEAF
jgi:hypothetical protein